MSSVEPLPGVTLVLGGAGSGKSVFAESLVRDGGRQPVYVATAEFVDDEMRHRIEIHRARRGKAWRTVEAPIELAQAIAQHDTPRSCLLVECLTVWLGNLIHHGRDVDAATRALLDALIEASGPVVLVANEVGLGIVPDNASARAFRDRAGRLNQVVARMAASVYFVTAGIPTIIKGPRPFD